MRLNVMNTKKDIKIWFWMQNKKIFKAISNEEAGTLTIYDECDNIILRRTGLSKQQVQKLVCCNLHLKSINDHKEPFTYL